jgi:hypothetical protein
MKRTILLILLLSSGIIAYPWGPTGHRATGHIAEKYLNKKAAAAIQKILKGQSLAMATTWMDEVRSDSTYDYMEDWHWVTIPFGTTYDQTKKNPKGDIVATLERVIRELKQPNVSEAKKLENIRILAHLIGDIHQPLHVGGKDDRGGNNVKVNWFRSESNLHRVWDSEMIDDSKLSYTELAESLDKPSAEQLKKWQKTSVLDWAAESQSYEKAVYNTGNGKLGYEYTYYNWHIVRLRLLQAGVRLAGVLNEIYGK